MTGNLLRASEASLSSATADAQAKGARIADLEKEIATAQEALKDALTQLKVCRLHCSNPSLPIHKLLPPLRVATIYPQVKFEDNQSLEKRVTELVEQYNTLRAEHEASTAARLEELATAKAELDTGEHPNKLSPLTITIDEPLMTCSVHPHLRPLVQSLSVSYLGTSMFFVSAFSSYTFGYTCPPSINVRNSHVHISALEELGFVKDENLTLSEKIQALIDRVNQAEAGSADIRSERDAYLDQRDRARAELERAEKKIEDLLEVQDELNCTVEELREKVESMSGLAGVEAERDRLLEKVRMLQEALEKSGAEKQELQQALAEAKAAGGGAAEKLHACEERIAELEREMAELERSLEKALASLDVQINENKGLAARVEQMVEEAKRQGEELSDAKREVGEAMTALGVANAEKATLLEKTRTLAEQIKVLMAKAQEVSGGSEVQIAELRQKCDALAAENAELKGERERANTLEAELKRVSGAKEELQGKIDKLSEANQELQDELEASRQGGAAGSKEVQRLLDRAAKLEAEIAQCRAALNKGFDVMKIRHPNNSAKAAGGSSSARGRAGQQQAMALTAMVDSMLDRYRGLEVMHVLSSLVADCAQLPRSPQAYAS